MQQVKTAESSNVRLGYVGLPPAFEFGEQQGPIGLDIRLAGVDGLCNTLDHTLEAGIVELATAALRGDVGARSPASCDAIVAALATASESIRTFGKRSSVLYDAKYVLPHESVDGRLQSAATTAPAYHWRDIQATGCNP